ncbi:TetR/AcrR family transcriptional regulator [Algoriphagus sp. H41]|uniref:TetR/AcrR family transcriptional regulator n=1 Tax=Algoriphagus oliviformis TaxID=2811231 RepID=A0ABS3C9X0_9BACT|nr:TetR/AcrR family transcriptional regulator [Algoriphagus oliviformis]MBN7812409.1 TetR/AcrR family transcriptional regulator [Algoriphagus oliviformis]
MDQIANKKVLILESALELIRENGFHGCPISQVAKQASVAAGSVYTYFESKDEMILELYRYVKLVVLEEIREKDDPEKNFEARFFDFWNNLTSLYREKPAFQSFLDQFTSSPYNTDTVQLEDDPWGRWTEAFFRAGVESGQLRPLNPKILSIMVMGSAISLIRYTTYFKAKTASASKDLHLIPKMVWDGIKFQ